VDKSPTPLLVGWIRDQAEHYGKLASNYLAVGINYLAVGIVPPVKPASRSLRSRRNCERLLPVDELPVSTVHRGAGYPSRVSGLLRKRVPPLARWDGSAEERSSS
jgi:hypothetical protein